MRKKDKANLASLVRTRSKLVKLRSALKNKIAKLVNPVREQSFSIGVKARDGARIVSDYELFDKELSMETDPSKRLEVKVIIDQIKSLSWSIFEIDKELSDKGRGINSFFTALNKNKNLFLFAVAALITGFLLVFFYQAMIEADFVKFKNRYNFYSTEETNKFYLLTGWKHKEDKDVKFAAMKAKRAVFLFSVPKADTLALKLTYRFPDRDQSIEVYSQEQLIGTLKADAPGKWVEKVLIFPHYLVTDDLNKVVFVKSLDSEPDLYEVVVSNYEERNLIFMKAYTVWESTRWFTKRRNNLVNWDLCLFGGAGFLCLWVAYSALFWLVTNEKYLRILKLDFWTYLPALAIFLMLFLTSKFLSNYTFFYYAIDYWLIVTGAVGMGKIYQIIRYGKMDKLKLRGRQAGNYTVGKYNLYGTICVIGFAVIFFGCAVLLMFNRKAQAEWLGNWAFLSLILGVALKTIDYFVQKEYLNDK